MAPPLVRRLGIGKSRLHIKQLYITSFVALGEEENAAFANDAGGAKDAANAEDADGAKHTSDVEKAI